MTGPLPSSGATIWSPGVSDAVVASYRCPTINVLHQAPSLPLNASASKPIVASRGHQSGHLANPVGATHARARKFSARSAESPLAPQSGSDPPTRERAYSRYPLAGPSPPTLARPIEPSCSAVLRIAGNPQLKSRPQFPYRELQLRSQFPPRVSLPRSLRRFSGDSRNRR